MSTHKVAGSDCLCRFVESGLNKSYQDMVVNLFSIKYSVLPKPFSSDFNHFHQLYPILLKITKGTADIFP